MNRPINTNDLSVKPVQLACAVCMKEIPLTAAIVPEATDYVVHFCSSDCYAKWQQQKGARPPEKAA